jgi:hypothetical protein
MRGRFIGLILGAVLCFVLMFSIFHWAYVPRYNGKISLSESQYSVFKEAIAQKDVTVDNINVLNSNEPVVVIFQVETKNGFPYGNKSSNPEYWASIILGVVGGASGCLLGRVYEN